MKRIVLFLTFTALTLFGGKTLSAQGKYGPDSTECIKYLSYYTDYYKQKNYDAALPNWRKAYKYCPPTARYSILSDGTTLIRNLINKNANNVVYKKQLIDSLITIYDQRVEFWPKYRMTSLNNKALDIYNYMKDEPMKLLESLNEIVGQTGNNTKPDIFKYQLNTAVDLYKAGMLDAENVISIYENGVECFSQMTPKNDVEKRSIESSLKDFESLFISSQVASCENLIVLFTPRYEADPQNLDLSKSIVKMMGGAGDCTNNDLFLNAVTTVYNIEPSYTSAYYLYKLYAGKNDMENAIKYMDEAISSPDSDDSVDAAYWYELAAFCFKNGNTAKAYSAAQEAAKLDCGFAGKAYMLIGTIWASMVCSGNEIERRAPYWVAVDYMTKAKNADPELAESANASIRQYSAYYPQTAEAFMFDITDGQSYTVSCGGLRAVTTVRTQK